MALGNAPRQQLSQQCRARHLRCGQSCGKLRPFLRSPGLRRVQILRRSKCCPHQPTNRLVRPGTGNLHRFFAQQLVCPSRCGFDRSSWRLRFGRQGRPFVWTPCSRVRCISSNLHFPLTQARSVHRVGLASHLGILVNASRTTADPYNFCYTPASFPNPFRE